VAGAAGAAASLKLEATAADAPPQKTPAAPATAGDASSPPEAPA